MMNSQVHQLRAEGIGDDARMRLFFETAVGQAYTMREEPSSVVQIMLFISKLVKEGKMDRNEAHMLKQLILQGDETLMALIKVYEVEHDLQELFDSLQRVIKKVQIDGRTATFDCYHPPKLKHDHSSTVTSLNSNNDNDNDNSTAVHNINDAFMTFHISAPLLQIPINQHTKEDATGDTSSHQFEAPLSLIPFPHVPLSINTSTNHSTIHYLPPRMQDWQEIGSDHSLLRLDCQSLRHSTKIAAFDLDGTLVKRLSDSNNYSTESLVDWELLFSQIPHVIRSLFECGYKCMIITNQWGVIQGKQTRQGVQARIMQILSVIAVPMQVLVAVGNDQYRKPSIEMWNHLCTDGNGGIVIDKSSSFYIGDAAGRERDYSCVDRRFAANVGIAFKTPEEFFTGAMQEPFEWEKIKHKPQLLSFIISSPEGQTIDQLNNFATTQQELLILVGFPCSGKTTLVERFLLSSQYVHIQPEKHSQEQSTEITRSALSRGLKVVIDALNASVSSRRLYIRIAQELHVPVRCGILQTNETTSQILDQLRHILSHKTIKRYSPKVYDKFKEQFQPPTRQEGFHDILLIPFHPIFRTEEERLKYVEIMSQL